MCRSKCSGSCVNLLNNKIIKSNASLTELNNLLTNITVCGAPPGTDKKLFMTEVINLRTEARKLLDEVNCNGERSPNGKLISTSAFGFPNISEDNSFKERLDYLKQKINTLTAQPYVINNSENI